MKTNPDSPISTINYGGVVNFGLTKREYFAALAMQGIWTNPHPIPIMGEKADAKSVVEQIAAVAVKQADALIEELNK